MNGEDSLDAIRQDPDPIRRGRRASKLISVYERRAAETAELRRQAIEDAYDQLDMSYTDIAAALNLTKGRITQIRQGTARNTAGD